MKVGLDGMGYLQKVSERFSLSIGGCSEGPYKWRKGVPSPKGNHEAEPGEEEDPAIDVPDIEERDGPSLSVDRIDLWGSPEMR